MQGIDVVMLTKNSEHLLEKCLTRVYENIPVKNLIIIDGFSTDKTLNILNLFKSKYGNIKVVKVNGSRAKARNEAVRHVTTDWFLFVDSDVLLSRDWFRRAQKNIGDDVGAVWGVNIDVVPKMASNKSFLKLQRLVARQCFVLRGGTHDTLIRTATVQDIKIPDELHTYEDAFIINWIKNRGFKAVVGDDIYCLHYKPAGNWNLNNAVSQAILELKCGLVYSQNFANIIYYPFFGFYWFLQLSIQNMKNLLGT